MIGIGESLAEALSPSEDYVFEADPLTSLCAELRENGYEFNVQNAVNYDRTDEFISYLFWKVNKGLNVIGSIIGQPGMGKSMAGKWIEFLLLLFSGRELDNMNTVFSITETRERLNDLKKIGKIKGVTILRDEQTIQGGQGMRHDKTYEKNIETTVRHYGVNIIYVYTELVEHSHHLILETMGEIDYEKGCSKLILYFKAPGMENFMPIGYIRCYWPPKKLLEGYIKRKEKNIDRLMLDEGEGRMKILESIAKELAENPLFFLAPTKQARMREVKKKAEAYTGAEKDDIYGMAMEEVEKRLPEIEKKFDTKLSLDRKVRATDDSRKSELEVWFIGLFETHPELVIYSKNETETKYINKGLEIFSNFMSEGTKKRLRISTELSLGSKLEKFINRLRSGEIKISGINS
jgi:predicted DNA-binding transcriptional regulator